MHAENFLNVRQIIIRRALTAEQISSGFYTMLVYQNKSLHYGKISRQKDHELAKLHRANLAAGM